MGKKSTLQANGPYWAKPAPPLADHLNARLACVSVGTGMLSEAKEKTTRWPWCATGSTGGRRNDAFEGTLALTKFS